MKTKDKWAYKRSLADDNDGDGLALTLRQSHPHAAALLPHLLIFVLAARGQQAAFEAAARQGPLGLVMLSLGAPSNKQRRVARMHHMTVTFLNWKVRQNSACPQRRKPIEASTHLVSPCKRPRIVAHDHQDNVEDPAAACSIRSPAKCTDPARIPPSQ